MINLINLYRQQIRQFFLLRLPNLMKITEVGKYKVGELIGSGSYGKVYKGQDRLTNEVVALKVIQRKGKNKRQIQNLRQEIQILKKLNHPNIVLLKDHVETDKVMILIMEYAPKDLAGVLKDANKFKEETIRDYASEIISALTYLNENRIVHRDLKPQNILLNQDGKIKICDFGFARKMSAATVCLHSMKGTPLYIAPEILEEKPYGPKIDVWSLGIILYELFTGFPPYLAETFPKLVVKIINDKVIFPSSMSVEFRQLVSGMLQKNPTNRYDWPSIQKHPFFSPAPQKIPEPPKPQKDSFLNQFSVIIKSVSKSISVNNELTLAVLKEHEKNLKQGGAKQLKTDMVFYHELVSLFMKSSSEQTVDVELLTVAFKVLILLINKVKVEEGQADIDITKKRDLFVAVVKLVGVIEDEECLVQLFTLCCFLLKSSFNNAVKEVDADIALDIIESSNKILQKSQVQVSIMTPMFKTLGTLAVQVSLTIRNSLEIFKMVNECKLLTAIAGKYRPEKEYWIVFECLERFVRPFELSCCNSEVTVVLNCLRTDTAVGLQPNIKQLPAVANIYSKTELLHFFHVLYGCVKASTEFCAAFSNCSQLKILYDSNKLYMNAINYIVIKSQNKQVLDLNELYADLSLNVKELSHLFQAALIFQGMKNGAIDSYPQKIETLVKKLGQILLQQEKLTEGVKQLEGWTPEYSEYSVTDIVVETVYGLNQISKNVSLLTSIREADILENAISSKRAKIGLQPKHILNYLQLANQQAEAFGIDQKGFEMLKRVLLGILNEETVGKIRESGEEQSTQLLHLVFQIICKLITKDQNQLTEFFIQLQALNVHRIMFIDPLLTERSLLCTLKVIVRVLKKCDPSILDYIAVQGLIKLKPFLTTRNSQLLSRLLQLVSTLARAKQDFYPKIQALSIVELLGKYLADQDMRIKIKALNLIGNMVRYENFFYADFTKNNILSAIVGTLSGGGSSCENVVFQAIFAIGNIAFFNEIPPESVSPLVPYLYQALSMSAEAFVCNTLGCITHLVRHSSKHLKTLKQGKVIPRIFQIIEQTKIAAVQSRALSCLDKLTERSEMGKLYSGDEIKCLVAKVKPLSTESKDKLQKISDKIK